jgi:hypothetical protein
MSASWKAFRDHLEAAASRVRTSVPEAAETDETPRLKAEAQKVRTELANLAEAVASGGAVIPALVAKMTERQGRLTAIDGRLEPSVQRLESYSSRPSASRRRSRHR